MGQRFVVTAMLLLLGGGEPLPPGVTGRLEHLRHHLRTHSAAGAQDAYKLLHQSVFGPGHLIPDRDAAARYLEREWAALGEALPGEPLLETLADEPPLVRVNLRPYRDAGGSRDALVDALVASAEQVVGDSALFSVCLEEAIAVVREERGEATAEELRRLSERAAGEGFPAMHHSGAYREAYRPAYRVVLRELAPRDLRGSPPASP